MKYQITYTWEDTKAAIEMIDEMLELNFTNSMLHNAATYMEDNEKTEEEMAALMYEAKHNHNAEVTF